MVNPEDFVKSYAALSRYHESNTHLQSARFMSILRDANLSYVSCSPNPAQQIWAVSKPLYAMNSLPGQNRGVEESALSQFQASDGF